MAAQKRTSAGGSRGGQGATKEGDEGGSKQHTRGRQGAKSGQGTRGRQATKEKPKGEQASKAPESAKAERNGGGNRDQVESGGLLQGLQGVAAQLQEVIDQLQTIVDQLLGGKRAQGEHAGSLLEGLQAVGGELQDVIDQKLPRVLAQIQGAIGGQGANSQPQAAPGQLQDGAGEHGSDQSSDPLQGVTGQLQGVVSQLQSTLGEQDPGNLPPEVAEQLRMIIEQLQRGGGQSGGNGNGQ